MRIKTEQTKKLYSAQCYVDKAIAELKEIGAKQTALDLIRVRNRIREIIDTIELDYRERE